MSLINCATWSAARTYSTWPTNSTPSEALPIASASIDIVPAVTEANPPKNPMGIWRSEATSSVTSTPPDASVNSAKQTKSTGAIRRSNSDGNGVEIDLISHLIVSCRRLYLQTRTTIAQSGRPVERGVTRIPRELGRSNQRRLRQHLSPLLVVTYAALIFCGCIFI